MKRIVASGWRGFSASVVACALAVSLVASQGLDSNPTARAIQPNYDRQSPVSQVTALWARHSRSPMALVGAAALTVMLTSWLIEHRRRREAELQARRHVTAMTQMDHRAAMGELTASLAHELHQPIGAILRNTEAAKMLLASTTPDIGELREILEDIHRDDKRAGEIIRRMRNLVRDRALSTEAVDINHVARESLAVVSADAAERGVCLEMDFVDGSCVVAGDPVCLEQVLLNLILNGMESMTRVAPDRRRLVVRTRRSEGRAVLLVEDSGSGFSPDTLLRVFEPFYTTKAEGMGMGLSISRRIVEAHYGQIAALNNAEGGAVMRVSLPLFVEGEARTGA